METMARGRFMSGMWGGMWAWLAVLVVALGGATSALAQTIDLRPKFTVGRDFRLTLVTEDTTSTSAEALDGAMKSSQRAEFRLLLKPTGTADDMNRVDLVFERVKYEIDTGETKAKFDSTKPPVTDEDKALAETLKPFVGATLKLTVDRDGNIKNIEGGDALVGGAMAGIGGQLGSVQGLNTLLGPMTSIKKAPGQVKAGQAWTIEDKTQDVGFGQMKVKTDYKAESVRAGIGTISFKGEFALSEEMASTGFKLKNAKYNGKYLWDGEAGMLKSLEMDQKMTLEQSGGDGGKPLMTVDRTAKTRVTREDVKATRDDLKK